MSDTPYITYDIPPISGTTPASDAAAVSLIDDRFATATTALNDLSLRIEDLTTKSAVIRQHVRLADGVFVGSLVYYDAANAWFANAQALTEAETNAGGETIEAPQARVEGIIISEDVGSNPRTGTILMGGYWNDDTVMNNCRLIGVTGEVTTSGTYYLSPTYAGHATKNTYGHLRQPVFTYYGSGAGFSMTLFYQAHDNHFHASQVLSAAWDEISGSTVQIAGTTSYATVPTGAKYYYTGAYAYGLGTLGDTTAVFYNGLLQDTWSTTTSFKISDGVLWKMDVGMPAAGSVTIFNHYPFAYDASVVRSVVSTNSAITVTNTNGLISITGNDFVSGDVLKGSYAVSNINGNVLNYTPVVTDVIAGPGINLTKALDGSVYVSAADRIGAPMDAYSINHNGTTLVSNGLLQYITFPASRLSSYSMTMPVTDINTPCKLSVWWMKLGTAAPQLIVTAKFIPDPTADSESSVSVLGSTAVTVNTTVGATADSLVYDEAEIAGCTVSGSGLLVAIVSSTVSTQAQFLRTGFKLDVLNNDANMTEYDNASITQTMPKGTQPISVGQAVMVLDNDGTPYLAPCTNVKGALGSNANRCVGVAITGSTALTSTDITYMITGTMTHTISGATAGQSLYIGTTGMLTPVTDSTAFLTEAAFLQKVGTVLTGNKIQINVESAVEGA